MLMSDSSDSEIEEDDPELTFAEEQVPFRERSYHVLSLDQAGEFMDRFVKELNSVLGLPEITLKILLDHFKWDKEKLTEKYFGGDTNQLFVEAKIINPLRTPSFDFLTHLSEEEEDECPICFDKFPPSQMRYTMLCSHRFCDPCWKYYIKNQIMDEGMGQRIPCAAPECSVLLDDDMVKSLITDADVRAKYQKMIISGFVQCNRFLRWCPAPDCDNVIKAESVQANGVTCTCSHTFCFACKEDWHEPVTCDQLKKWIARSSEDSESLLWMSDNTKECPKCRASIEKNGGCNHMTCKNLSCGHEFCWICMGNWRGHNQCNHFEAEKNQENRRINVERYMFYFDRYSNHLKSLESERKLYDKIKEKVDSLLTMDKIDLTRVDMEFLKQAVDVLCQCRRTLIHSFIFAYFMEKSNHLAIFEDNQTHLQKGVETLCEYLERHITLRNLKHLKQVVVDKSKYCNSRREALIQQVNDGYEEGIWIP